MKRTVTVIVAILTLTACHHKQQPIYANEDKIDTIRSFCENGALKSVECKLHNRLNGVCLYYYCNGNISGKYTYRNGIKDGPFETFYSNGTLRSQGILANDSIVSMDYWIINDKGKLLEHRKLPK